MGLSWPIVASAAPHKPHRSQQPAHDDGDTTGTIATPQPTPSAPQATVDERDEKLVQFHLPAASRARMRDCGKKWDGMKMSGEAGDDTWREFATRCLSANDGPFEKTSRK